MRIGCYSQEPQEARHGRIQLFRKHLRRMRRVIKTARQPVTALNPALPVRATQHGGPVRSKGAGSLGAMITAGLASCALALGSPPVVSGLTPGIPWRSRRLRSPEFPVSGSGSQRRRDENLDHLGECSAADQCCDTVVGGASERCPEERPIGRPDSKSVHAEG